MFARLSAGMFGTTVAVPRVGRFVVHGLIGSGGMGRVYEAVDEDLGRRVALKLLHTGMDAEQRQRLRKEAQTLARLNHPNVVHVYEVGDHEGAPFVAMELVEGSTLATWQRARSRSWSEVLEVYRQAARGLVAAHAAGVIHRDFKPGNAILGSDGRVRVVDLGLAKEITSTAPLTRSSSLASAITDEAFSEFLRTRTGTLIGTPAYMSPEQLMGGTSGPASDQYSFCVSLFEALFGHFPFAGDDRNSRLQRMLSEQWEQPRGAWRYPRWLRATLRRGLRARPEKRHVSMDALLHVLERPPARRKAIVLGGVTTAPLLVALWAWSPSAIEACIDEQSLAGVWDDLRKREVARAFAQEEFADAATQHLAVVEALDAFAGQWQLARREVCETGAQRGQGDTQPVARLECLDLRRRELASLTSLLAHADATVVRRARLLVDALPSVDTCLGVFATPAPQDVEALASLTEARLLRAAGRFPEALAILESVVQAPQIAGHEQLRAGALFEQGITLDRQGRHEEALERLRSAEALAIAHEAPTLVVDAALKLAQIQLYPFGRIDAAADALDRVDKLVGKLPYDARRLAAWHRVRGMLASVREQPELAIAEHEQEVTLVRSDSPPDPGQLSESISLLANAMAEGGQLEHALALHREVVELRERTYGPAHPLLARALLNEAIVLHELGRPGDARREYERGLKLLDGLEDPREHWADAASIRQGLALVLAELEPTDLARSIALARQAQAILSTRLPPVDPSRINVARTLCNLYANADRGEDALRCYLDQEHLHDSNGLDGEVWDLRVNIAQSLIEQGRYVEARSYLADVLHRVRFELGAHDPRIVLPLAVLVEAEELPGGDQRRARAAMEEIRAERAHEAEVEPEHADYVSQAIAYGTWRLALQLHDEGYHAREAELLNEATVRYSRLGEGFEGPARVEEIARWRAGHRRWR